MDRSTSSKLRRGGVAAQSAGAAQSVPTSPFLTTVSRLPGAPVSRLPRLAPASPPGRAAGAAPPRVKAGQVVVHGRSGPARPGLDARVVDWAGSHGRQRPYGLVIQYWTQRVLNASL
jgi:hypothetical protein